ncbi:hypothetical protein [uncultured Aquimarina sp.]|uniref:hypothetical protein n=1 Tax=uncultured Aquimarina sp. TaxID=575652 RepID=UPI00262F73F9|nr:hypothetical protein [uncultured Aquimarina sp.]
MFKRKNDHSFIQHHMYEGKHSKSIYKGFKTSMFILISLLIIGGFTYRELLQYEAGFISNNFLFWLYEHIGFMGIKIMYGFICLLVVCIGIWDVRRLKKIKNNEQ